jgi:putative sigma-54 modulation protein
MVVAAGSARAVVRWWTRAKWMGGFHLTHGGDGMRIDVIGRNIDVTDAIKQYAETKAGKLPKYFDGLQAVTVTISKRNHDHSVEIEAELVLDVEKHEDFVSRAVGKDAYAAIDLVSEKGERQLRDFKEILKQKKH